MSKTMIILLGVLVLGFVFYMVKNKGAVGAQKMELDFSAGVRA